MRIFFLVWLLCLPAPAQSHLEEIARRGTLRVGTTGDYPPFSLAQENGYQGFDIDLAVLAARKLGVEVQWVPTGWADLTRDLRADRYDLAVGGITRTLTRAREAGFSRPLVTVGKVPLVRRGDESRFDTPEEIDRPEVRVASNCGGTNESYARQHFAHAQLVLVEDNLAIPERLAGGQVDVFMTDSVEAARAVARDPRLALATQPWTRESLGWLTPRDDQAWLNWINLFLEECEGDGTLAELRHKHGF